MNTKQLLIAQWNNESKSTRRMLERVPTDQLSYKPHEKNMTLGYLAQHVASCGMWAQQIIGQDAYTPMEKLPEATSTEDLLAVFDKYTAQALHLLENASDAEFAKEWDFRGMMKMPKGLAVQSFMLNHTIHHRGQLSIYLRLLNIPMPGMYGPSADEK